MATDQAAVLRAFVAYKESNYVLAVRTCNEILKKDPKNADVWCMLGLIQRESGDVAAAVKSHREALSLKGDLPEARINLAHALLAMGDWEQGFAEYEWRFTRLKSSTNRAPRWDGRSSLSGKTILLHAEQGAGDTILCIRYARKLKEMGARVELACPKELMPLFFGVEYIDQLVPSEKRVSCNFQAPLMSLPGLFGSRPGDVPDQVPYLSVDDRLVEYWRGELASLKGLKVGIIWQGNPEFAGDGLRSIPLKFYEPLASVPGVNLISLQKKHGLEQLKDIKFPVINLDARMDEAAGAFVHTAAAMKALDLVITSDTSVAHLAGALGVRTWMAAPFAAHWYWLLDRETSPWYPSMRLFRQRTVHDWAGVFHRISSELHKLSEEVAVRPTGVTDRAAVVSAWQLFQKGDAVQAVTISQQVLKMNPGDADVWCLLGIFQRHAAQLEQAVASQREAIKLRPDFIEAWNNLGTSLSFLGRLEEAAGAFRHAIQVRPDCAEARANLASLEAGMMRPAAVVAAMEPPPGPKPVDATAVAAMTRPVAPPPSPRFRTPARRAPAPELPPEVKPKSRARRK